MNCLLIYILLPIHLLLKPVHILPIQAFEWTVPVETVIDLCVCGRGWVGGCKRDIFQHSREMILWQYFLTIVIFAGRYVVGGNSVTHMSGNHQKGNWQTVQTLPLILPCRMQPLIRVYTVCIKNRNSNKT